jgi:hypothetical protein
VGAEKRKYLRMPFLFVPLVPCPACGFRTFDGGSCSRCRYDAGGGSIERRGAAILRRISAFLHRPALPPHRQNIPWRDPHLAAGMSLAVIGSGHFYVGRYREGAAYLGAAVALTWAIVNVSIFSLFFLAVLWEFQITEAFDAAVEFDWNSIIEADSQVP